MKSISFYILLVTLLVSTTIYSSENERVNCAVVAMPLNGVYAIPGDFATINDAAISLNTNGISGPVVFNVAANHTETAPAGTSALLPGGITFGNIIGTSAINTITFQKNGIGSNPLVTAGLNHFAGGIMDAVIKFIGSDYIVFDGINVSENPLNVNVVIASNTMTEFGFAFFYANPAATANGAQFNTIKNSIITLNTGGTNYQNTFGIYSTTITTPSNGTASSPITAITGSNSNNKLYGNTINNANFGISIIGSNTPAAMDVGWDIGGSSAITGNSINNFGIGNGTAASAYQKIGVTAHGILINQIANNTISYNTITSTAGTSTTLIVLVGIFLGWSGAMVQSPTNTSFCNNNTITITNGLSESTCGIWSRIGNATSSKTINNNSITLINTSTIAITTKLTRGILQDILIGELITSNNTISIHYENSNHAHPIYYIQTDIDVSINRQINDNTLLTPVGKTLRTSAIVMGITHTGLSLGTISVKRNTISINKGNSSSTANFFGINSTGLVSTATLYEISENTIILTNSSTTNSATTIIGINNSDGSATVNKTISSNIISLVGTNTGGTSLGIQLGRTGTLIANSNNITISNFSPSITGIFLTTGCTVNNLNSNIITISPIGMPATVSIWGINNAIGTPTISNNEITISPTIVPLATTTFSSQAINNAFPNGVISNNTKIHISPTTTEPIILVNFSTTGIFNSGANTQISNNTNFLISSSTLTGTVTSTAINNNAASTVISNNSTITLTALANTTATIQGIVNTGTTSFIQNNNGINVSSNATGIGILNGINNNGATATITQNQNISITCSTINGNSRVFGINNAALTTIISSNSNINLTANSTNSTTLVRGISTSVISTITNNTNIIINANAGTISTTVGIYGFGTISNNTLNVSSNALTGIDLSVGIQSESNTTVSDNNCITNFYTDSGNVIAYGINSNNSNSTIANNIVDHTAISNGNQVSLTWFASIYGIRSIGSNTILDNNKIIKVYGSMGKGTTIFEIAGIALETALDAMISNNVISNVSSNGTADNRTYISGIYALTGSYNATIKNNRIYNISLNNSITGTHPGPGFNLGQPLPANTNGIWLRLSFNTVLNNYKIYNNHISKLYSPSASNLGGIFGMALSSREVNHSVYNNTILIGDNSNQITSNITGDFGASAIGYINRVGTGVTDVRNNILYVNVLPNGSGYVSALAAIKNHDSDLFTFFTNPGQTGIKPPNYAITSNNNLFYAPSVPGRRSYFYCEGNGLGTEFNRFNIDHNTTSINDPNINVISFVSCTSKFKTLMDNGDATDSNSFYDNVTLTEGIGTDEGYWTPSGETYAEMGAQVLPAEYDLDSKNVSRGATPDIGALQFSAIIPTPPNIVYGPLVIPGSCGGVVSSINLDNVHITDIAGVPTMGSLIPRLYYKVNSGSYTSVAGTLTSGDGFDGYWSFTLTGLSAGTISYYVIAQDRLTKIISNPSLGLLACNVNSVTTHPTSPSTLIMGGSTAIYSLGAWSIPPTISTAVIFDDDFSSTVDIEACSVLVKAGRTVVFNSVHSLLVQNEVIVEPTAKLQFENNSKLVQIANIANTGDIIYKRIALVKKFDYVYWSSPVDGFNLDNLNLLLPTGPKYKWEPILANNNGGLGKWVLANANIMDKARGFIVRSPISYSVGSITPFLTTFTGVPNNGDISYPIYRGAMTAASLSGYTSVNGTPFSVIDDNMNLIGNPYPSAISANHLLYQNRQANGGDLAGYVDIWRHGIDLQTGLTNPFYGSFLYNYDPNDYLTYNLVGASCCPLVGDYKIGAGQGFFVQMLEGNAASGVVNFTNIMRRDLSNVPYDNATFYRNSETTSDFLNPERHRIWLDLVKNETQSERILVGYIDGATNNFDSFYDVPTKNKNSLDLYSLIDSQHYKIEGRTLPFNIDDEVPLGFNTSENGLLTFAIGAVDGLFNAQNIYLKDVLLNITHDLKTSPYVFYSDIGNHNDRFILVYKNNTLNSPQNSIENAITVLSYNKKITIKSSLSLLDELKFYDVSGRLLLVKNKINANEIIISDLTKSDQIIIVEIKTEDGIKTIKKINN